MSGALASPLNTLLSGPGNLFSTTANGAASYVGGGIVHSIEKAIETALRSSITGIGQALVDATKLHLGNSFMSVYDAGLEVVAMLAVFVLIIGAAKGAITGNISYVFQTVVRVIGAIIGSFLLVALIPYVQSAFGAFSNIFATSFGSNVSGFGTKLAVIIMTSSFIGGAPMTFIILGVLILMAIFATSVVLGLSGVVAYIAVMFAPFAFLISAKAAKKTLEVLVVALATPTIITAIMALGLAVFSASGSTASAWIGSTFEGLGILLLAAFSPLAVMKLLPVGEEAIAKMGAHHQQAKSMAQSTHHSAGAGLKSAKDIATMVNPAMAGVLASLRGAGSASSSGGDSGVDTSGTSGSGGTTPQKQTETGSSGSTGQGGNPSTPNTPNGGSTPNTPEVPGLGTNGTDQNNQDPPDPNQPPPPQDPKDKP